MPAEKPATAGFFHLGPPLRLPAIVGRYNHVSFHVEFISIMAQASNTRIKVGIVGGTGYTGVELLRLLSQHPNVELTAITSRKEDGLPVADMYPNLRGRVKIAFSAPEKASLTDCDVVFFATPHGVAMAQTPELIAAGTRVIDLAADFRLQDIPTFERWYKIPHTCPEVLAESQYGLVELNREAISKARVIGNPAATRLRCCWAWLRCWKAARS